VEQPGLLGLPSWIVGAVGFVLGLCVKAVFDRSLERFKAGKKVLEGRRKACGALVPLVDSALRQVEPLPDAWGDPGRVDAHLPELSTCRGALVDGIAESRLYLGRKETRALLRDLEQYRDLYGEFCDLVSRIPRPEPWFTWDRRVDGSRSAGARATAASAARARSGHQETIGRSGPRGLMSGYARQRQRRPGCCDGRLGLSRRSGSPVDAW
jgi:hypothetical protein